MRKCTSRTRLVLQSCDFQAGAAEVYFAHLSCTTKLRFSSWSCGSVFRVLVLYYKVAIFELQKCTSRTCLVLQSCEFRAGDAEVYFAYLTCTTKFRFSSWKCGSVLRVLDLYYKVAIFELELRKCTSRTCLVLQSCDFRAAEVYFAYLSCTTKLRVSSWKCGSVLRVLDLYYKVATFELELRKCISRFSSWSYGSVFRVLDFYYKVAIFEPDLPKFENTVKR